MMKADSKVLKSLIFCIFAILLSGCVTTPPNNIDNICAIFEEKQYWYESAKNSYRRWDVPVPVMMAIIHQESRFQEDAKPPRTKILWVFPGPRPSSAYGYAQALKSTWEMYVRSTGKRGADRDDFADVIDFVGWYCNLSHKKCGISKKDAYRLYLAHHEGQEGFNNRTYREKPWLLEVAKKVKRRSKIYSRQFARCQDNLE